MERTGDPRGRPNAIGRALGLLGEEWTLLLLRESLLGASRYGSFRAALGISDAVLANRLQRLVDGELFARHVYQDSPSRAEYELTASGSATWPILFGIWAWEQRWVRSRASELPIMVHRTCENVFEPIFGCDSCRWPVRVDSLDVRWGPAGGWPRSIPRSTTRRRGDAARGSVRGGHFPDTMTIIGNRWASALMAAAFMGSTRFREFESRLQIPAAILAQRLEEFREVGVFQRVALDGHASHEEYVLSPKGVDFLPVVLTLVSWAQRWLPDDDGRAIEVIHTSCGQHLEPRWRCGSCGLDLEPVMIQPVTIEPGSPSPGSGPSPVGS